MRLKEGIVYERKEVWGQVLDLENKNISFLFFAPLNIPSKIMTKEIQISSK